MKEIHEKVAMEALDPEHFDPGYWDRFQDAVMRAAGPALALRRQSRDLTMAELLSSWSRLLIPTSVMAAAAAAFILVAMEPHGPADQPLLSLEEILAPVWGERAEPLPSFLHSESPPDRDAVLFAIEGF